MAWLLGLLCIAATAYGQGQFVFNNRIGTEVNAGFTNPCIDPPGYSSIGSPDWTVLLFGGPVGSAFSELQPLDPPLTIFRGPAGSPTAGYVVGITPKVPGVPAGANASILLRLVGPGRETDFGPYTVNGLGGGVFLPPNLQLGTSGVITFCPEPSTHILGLIGAAGLLTCLVRRKAPWGPE